MGTFKIEGGHKLHGEITPQGAKNEALQILCAVLLTPDEVVVNNIPDIVDVNKLISLLEDLGVKVQKKGKGSYSFKADDINLSYLQSEQFKSDGRGLRGSIMLVGPLLARYGKGYIPKPGGDKIGRRRLDTHFEGFIQLGAKFRYNKEEHFYGVEAEKLKGTYMLLDEASVTGTANIVMAAVLADMGSCCGIFLHLRRVHGPHRLAAEILGVLSWNNPCFSRRPHSTLFPDSIISPGCRRSDIRQNRRIQGCVDIVDSDGTRGRSGGLCTIPYPGDSRYRIDGRRHGCL